MSVVASISTGPKAPGAEEAGGTAGRSGGRHQARSSRKAWNATRLSDPGPKVATAPANDDRKLATAKPTIVTTTSRKQRKLDRESRRREDRLEDPQEAAARIRAWLEKAKWDKGPWP
jgi:hypothetical protein